MSYSELEQWLTLTPNSSSLSTWMAQALQIGIEELNLETGVISKINNRDYVVLQSISKIGELVSPGDKFELNNTYCEAVVRQHRTITYIQVGNIPEMRLHPIYQSMQLESYIGSPIRSDDGNVFGTISFTSHNARAMVFSNKEIEFVESITKRLAEIFDKSNTV